MTDGLRIGCDSRRYGYESVDYLGCGPQLAWVGCVSALWKEVVMSNPYPTPENLDKAVNAFGYYITQGNHPDASAEKAVADIVNIALGLPPGWRLDRQDCPTCEGSGKCVLLLEEGGESDPFQCDRCFGAGGFPVLMRPCDECGGFGHWTTGFFPEGHSCDDGFRAGVQACIDGDHPCPAPGCVDGYTAVGP